MQISTRVALAAAVLASLLGSASQSAAKTVCGTLGDTNDRFYVIEKIKTKDGARGLVSGYFVGTGSSSPFSGHYFVAGGVAFLSVSEGVSSNGFANSSRLHNFSAPLAEGGSGTGFATVVNGASDTVLGLTPTTTGWVDCKTVPEF
jgi:hypothetical protein